MGEIAHLASHDVSEYARES